MALFSRIKALYGSGDSGDDSSLPFSLVSAATANLTLVKNGPGIVTAIHAIGQTANIRYLKFYDMNSVPVAGAAVPVRRFAIPGAVTGAGICIMPSVPMRFLTGIAFAIVAGTGLDADTTAVAAGDVILTLEYI